ncbi:hypothetical protein SLA2020_288910 [Shorea laevis]
MGAPDDRFLVEPHLTAEENTQAKRDLEWAQKAKVSADDPNACDKLVTAESLEEYLLVWWRWVISCSLAAMVRDRPRPSKQLKEDREGQGRSFKE